MQEKNNHHKKTVSPLRNPVEVGSLSHYLQGIYTSQVVRDFWTINSNTQFQLRVSSVQNSLDIKLY